MASSAILPAILDIVELRAHGLGVPVLFPITNAGFASVSAVYLSVRFLFKESSILIEHEIYDPATSLVFVTIPESSKVTESGSIVWELGAGKYRVYGLSESQMGGSIEVLTPLWSTTSTLNIPLLAKVKVEPGAQLVVDISDSSNEDAPKEPIPIINPSTLSQSPCPFTIPTASASPIRPPDDSVPLSFKQSGSIVRALRRLGSMRGKKSILKKLDYDHMKIEEVSYLPPRFDGPCMFVLPLAGASSSTTMAKSMEGMDKQYDRHVWTKTQTTNISNDDGLVFCSSNCIGHL